MLFSIRLSGFKTRTRRKDYFMKTSHKIARILLLLLVVISAAVLMVEKVTYTGRQMPLAETTLKVWIDTDAKTAAKTPEPTVEPVEETKPIAQATTGVQYTPAQSAPPVTEAPAQGVDADIAAIAKTLAAECYDHNVADKRGVAEVILNRVSKGYGSTVIEVLTAPHQFAYNSQKTPSESDLAVATQAVQDWYANDCQALSGYLYFSAGGGDSNVFRETY